MKYVGVFTRSICFLLIATLLLSIFPTVTANNTPQPRYITILFFQRYLSINDSGKATCRGTIDTRVNGTTKLIIKLQKKISGSWVTIKTWEDTGGSYMNMTREYYVDDGYSYQIHVDAYVYDINGTLLENTYGTAKFDY